MFRYTIRRLLLVIPVAWVVLTAVFLAMRLLPGDPADLLFGEQALASDKAAWLHAHGLDRPIARQYLDYLVGLGKGDLGKSFTSERRVGQMIGERYPKTLELTLYAMGIGVLVAFPLGMIAARRKGKWPDHASRVLSLAGISVPTLFTGPLLMLLFGVYLGWLPVSGRVLPGSWVLPSLTLGIAMAAFLARIVRASLIDVQREDFVRTAKAKGLSNRAVFWKHALKAAMVPILTVLGLQFGALLAGAVVTEKIFAWPGMGTLLIEAIGKRDYAVVQGCILTMSLTYVVVNAVTDLSFAVFDPRIALTRKG